MQLGQKEKYAMFGKESGLAASPGLACNVQETVTEKTPLSKPEVFAEYVEVDACVLCGSMRGGCLTRPISRRFHLFYIDH
jgi:hypothetical protein